MTWRVGCPRCGDDARPLPHVCGNDGEIRLVQLTADQHGLAGLDRDGRVWAHIPGNGWTPIPMNVIEARKEP